MFSMNLSAPVVAKAEADAGAYTVGQAAHDLELLRSPATDLPTGQYNVGGTGECAGRVHGSPLPGSPSSAHSGSCGVVEPAARRPPPLRGLSGVGLTSAPHRTFADPAPPLPTYSATPPPPDPIIPDATHPTCLSALPTTPVYRSRACRGATVGPSVADLCTLGDLPTCGIFVSCVPPVVP